MTRPKEFVARSLRIPADLYGRLEQVSQVEGKSVAKVLREMLERGLNLYHAALAAERAQAKGLLKPKNRLVEPKPTPRLDAGNIDEEYDLL